MSKKPFVQEYIENRFEEAKEYEAEIARLKAENDYLKDWLEVKTDIIKNADANREAWRKEAVRLRVENARLKAELENWQKRGSTVVANVAGLVKEVDRLKADKAKLVEALKTIISKARGDSVAAHVAVAVIKEVQHD